MANAVLGREWIVTHHDLIARLGEDLVLVMPFADCSPTCMGRCRDLYVSPSNRAEDQCVIVGVSLAEGATDKAAFACLTYCLTCPLSLSLPLAPVES